MDLKWKENDIEQLICETLEELHFNKKNSFNIDDQRNVINYNLLEESLLKINSHLNNKYINEAIKKIKNLNLNFEEGNCTTLKWLKEGLKIKVESISSRTENIYLVDYNNIDNNTFDFIPQMEISDGNNIIRTDIIIYLNGLPISIIELKAPSAKEKLNDAYKQLKYYANFNPNLMYWNVFSCVSNGWVTRYGSVTSNFNSHWWPWNLNKDGKIKQDIDEKENPMDAINNYYKNIVGIYNKKIFLNMLQNYIFIAKNRNTYTKYIPTYYQYNAVENTLKSLENSRDNRIGVVWHTQGSGKSVTMLFLTSRIKTHFKNTNYKIVLVTDRTDLDNQLYKRFCEAQDDYLFTKPIQIKSRKDLKNTLSDDDDFGIYMTMIQKFTESKEPLSNKNNIIIIADEAHRSHNNIEPELIVDRENRELIEKEGYAKYIRDAFPNAKFIGFTGTPLMATDKKTIDVFGNYIDKYSMSQSVKDGSTVPIFYEKRRIKLLLEKKELLELDQIYNEDCNLNESSYINNEKYQHIKKQLINLGNILSDPEVITCVVKDFWEHYDNRKRALNGKAMFVAFNRNIAHLIYKEIINQRPEFKDYTKLIITGSNKDDTELAKLIPTDEQKSQYATEFKKNNSKIKIAIVVDMWLTGFDVPDLDTLYLFKVIRWHNLMQTIARVNRTYEEKDDTNKIYKQKNAGLIVDYIGIWKNISEALKQYTDDKDDTYNLEKIKTQLQDLCLKIYKKFFDMNKNLVEEWIKSDNEDKNNYNRLIKAVDTILSLDKNMKDEFFAITNKISKAYKLCSTILDLNQKREAQLYILIRNFIRNTKVEEAIDVAELLKKLKKKLPDIIKTGDIEVNQILLNGQKDLTYVFELLQKERKMIKENQNKKNDNLKVLTLNNEIKEQINIFSKTNPIKAQELSNDLKKLIEQYEYDKNIEEYMEGLIKFSKIMIEQKRQADESGIEDEKILVFYNIIADEKFKLQHHNSEILREITEKIIKSIKQEYTPQWYSNSRIRDNVNLEIKKLLKKEYNYPPEDAKEISKIMIDEINKVVKRNPDFFINKEEN